MNTQKNYRPKNALILCVVVNIFFIISMGINYWVLNSNDPIESTFILAGAGILLYGVFSAIMMMFSNNTIKAWNYSVIGFIVTALILTGFGILITGSSWNAISFYRPILYLLVAVYFIIMIIAISIKSIVKYAQEH